MRNKLTFILPRVAGVTLAVGLGALLLFLVFKVLVAVTVLALLFLAVKTLANSFRQEDERWETPYAGTRGAILPVEEAAKFSPIMSRGRQSIVPID